MRISLVLSLCFIIAVVNSAAITRRRVTITAGRNTTKAPSVKSAYAYLRNIRGKNSCAGGSCPFWERHGRSFASLRCYSKQYQECTCLHRMCFSSCLFTREVCNLEMAQCLREICPRCMPASASAMCAVYDSMAGRVADALSVFACYPCCPNINSVSTNISNVPQNTVTTATTPLWSGYSSTVPFAQTESVEEPNYTESSAGEYYTGNEYQTVTEPLPGINQNGQYYPSNSVNNGGVNSGNTNGFSNVNTNTYSNGNSNIYTNTYNNGVNTGYYNNNVNGINNGYANGYTNEINNGYSNSNGITNGNGNTYTNTNGVTNSNGFPINTGITNGNGNNYPTNTGVANGNGNGYPTNNGVTNTNGNFYPTNTDVTNGNGNNYPTNNGITNTNGNVYPTNNGVTNGNGNVYPANTGVTNGNGNNYPTNNGITNSNGNIYPANTGVTNGSGNNYPTNNGVTNGNGNNGATGNGINTNCNIGNPYPGTVFLGSNGIFYNPNCPNRQKQQIVKQRARQTVRTTKRRLVKTHSTSSPSTTTARRMVRTTVPIRGSNVKSAVRKPVQTQKQTQTTVRVQN